MKGVHPDMILIAAGGLNICPIDIGIPQDAGVRTTERQHAMFLDPNIQTNADGYNQLSNHQIPPGGEFGMALDVYAYINGKPSWARHHLAMIHTAFQITADRLLSEDRITHRLAWGGTFGSNDMTGWDSAHHELRDI